MKQHPNHSKNLVALRRIEGQVRGIQKMIEDRKYCVDIVTQIGAIRGALSRVEDKVLEKHLEHCVSDAIKGKSESDKKNKLKEIIKLVNRSRKR